MDNSHKAFEAAERLAPLPATREEATANAWVRHYAALSLAAFATFYTSLPSTRGAEVGSRPDLGYLCGLGVAAMSTAFTLDSTAFASAKAGALWDLTPELGALNGEYEEWLVRTLDRLGVNPADIDPRFVAADFNSPSTREL